MRRIGDETKCPACGWRIDAEAYRCPKCLIYFCYKCRKRVTKSDDQFQCANQACECYGKLLCAACTVMVPKFDDVTLPNVKPGASGMGCFAYVAAAIIGIIVWCYFSFFAGVFAAIVTIVVGAVVIAKNGGHFTDQPTQYTNTVVRAQVGNHRCCIQCKKPAEVI